MSTIRDLADYYVARLASQYRTLTKAPAQLALFAKQLMADALAMQIDPSFNVDTAQGQQLDIIGKYVGADRDVQVPDTSPYFGFITYGYPTGTQNLNGFTSYASLSLNSTARWFRYQMAGQSTSQLPDYLYAQLLKLKIVTNSSDNTMASVQAQIDTFFSGQLQLRDNKDMSLTYFYGRTFQLPKSVLTAALPRPMGVRVTAVEASAFDISMDGTPVFNSGIHNPVVNFGTAGYGSAHLFRLTNVNPDSISIQSITSTPSDVFSVSSITPSLPASIGLNQYVEFQISGSTTIPGIYSATISIQYQGLAGLSFYEFTVTIDITGISITWISFDNFEEYADGSVSSLGDSWGWAELGIFPPDPWSRPRDDFESYAVGIISSLTGGTDWVSDGTFTTYPNS